MQGKRELDTHFHATFERLNENNIVLRTRATDLIGEVQIVSGTFAEAYEVAKRYMGLPLKFIPEIELVQIQTPHDGD